MGKTVEQQTPSGERPILAWETKRVREDGPRRKGGCPDGGPSPDLAAKRRVTETTVRELPLGTDGSYLRIVSAGFSRPQHGTRLGRGADLRCAA
jgi:hypothetical protein